MSVDSAAEKTTGSISTKLTNIKFTRMIKKMLSIPLLAN